MPLYIHGEAWHAAIHGVANSRTQLNDQTTTKYMERKQQPTPVFLPGKSHELRSVVGYNPWGHTEL